MIFYALRAIGPQYGEHSGDLRSVAHSNKLNSTAGRECSRLAMCVLLLQLREFFEEDYWVWKEACLTRTVVLNISILLLHSRMYGHHI